MPKPEKFHVGDFIVETLLYGAAVAIYCFCVYHYLGDWLAEIYHQRRWMYAFAGLALMVIQGFVLERVAHAVADAILRRGKARP